MNKSELVLAVAKETGLTKIESEKAVSAVVDAITTELKQGNTVQLVGFGTFTVRQRKARTGRNPRTGEQIQIQAAASPVFTPGKALKDAVKKG